MSAFDPSDYPDAFATPAGCAGIPLASVLASAYLDAIHSQVRTGLDRTNEASACRFEANVGSRAMSGNAWRPECGLVLEALKRRQSVRAAAQLGLALAAIGRQVTFDAVFDRPTRLFLDGHLFEVSGRASIATKNDEIVVTADGAGLTLRFSLHARGWRATHEFAESPGAIFAPLDLRGGHRAHAYAIAVPEHRVDRNDFYAMCERHPNKGADESIDIGGGQPDLAGLAFVETFAPGYAAWNRPVSCGVLLQRATASGMARSSSACSRPGLIFVSQGTPASVQGELFVHENAHQHLMLYELFVPLTDETDTAEFYSPIKGLHRNARRALLAVHAIGNMLLYYMEAYRNEANLVHAKSRIEQYFTWFIQMKEDLTDSPALTMTGRRLLSSLVAAVEAADVSRAM